jgi:ribosomal protein S6
MSKEKTVESNENKGLYELAFHLIPTLGDDNVGKVFDEITKLVEKFNGKIVSKSEPTLLNLEYTMEVNVDSKKVKYNTAYFAWVIFEGGDVQELHTELEAMTDVLRHLLVKTDQTEGISSEEVAAMLSDEEEETSEEVKEEASVQEKTEETAEESKGEANEDKKADETKVDEAIDELVK